jgi:NTP pyrophosphatase (non-canonical NTP hydrolase)
MKMQTFSERFAAVNLARCLRWHPRGLGEWSIADWTVAMAGEVGEVCEVVAIPPPLRITSWRELLQNEIGDVFAYLDLLAQAAGEKLAVCIEATPPALWPMDIQSGAMLVATESGKLCDVVKKLNRVRDGLPGNTAGAAQLHHQFRCRIGAIARALEVLADYCAMDLESCVAVKFNAVSERWGFPERM